jgi:hypothetical protein
MGKFSIAYEVAFPSTRNASVLISLFGGRDSPKTKPIISSRRFPAIYLIAMLPSNRPSGGSLSIICLFAVPETFVDFLNGRSSTHSRTCSLAVQYVKFSLSSMDWMRAKSRSAKSGLRTFLAPSYRPPTKLPHSITSRPENGIEPAFANAQSFQVFQYI